MALFLEDGKGILSSFGVSIAECWTLLSKLKEKKLSIVD